MQACDVLFCSKQTSKDFVSYGFDAILQLYSNTTACEEIIIGEPPREANLTVLTTSYPRDFDQKYVSKMNDPRYVCTFG